jgi:hypothetical protein
MAAITNSKAKPCPLSQNEQTNFSSLEIMIFVRVPYY